MKNLRRILSFYYFAVLFYSLNFHNIHAQNYQIKAQIKTTTDQTLDYVNVAVFNQNDALIFGKTFLDNDILIQNLPLENLKLKISHLETENFEIQIKKEDFLVNSTLDLGLLILKDQSLEAVEVSTWKEKKAFIERDLDKTIVHIEDQPLLQNSNDLFELFRKTPGLQVDAQDQVNIVGRGGAVILINGKRVPPGALYAVVPAQVKDIEIIDPATGKIQAIAGSSLVINVVTKTAIANSWFVNSSIFGAGLKNNWSAGLQSQAGVQWEKWTMSTYYNYSATESYSFKENIWRNDPDFPLWNQNNNYSLSLNNHSYGLQIDYNLTKNQDLSLKYSGRYFLDHKQEKYKDQDGFEKKMSQNNLNFYQQFDTDYRFILDSLGSSLDAHFQFLDSKNTTSEPIWTLIKPDPNETIPYFFSEKTIQNAVNSSVNYEHIFKPIATEHQFTYSTGLSYLYEKSVLKILNSTENQGGNYDSHTENLYNTLRYKYKKWTYELSLNISAYYFNLEQETQQKDLQWNYSPNFKFHYLINEKFQFSLIYNYNFDRPYIPSLLSYSAYDPNTYFVSNPDLKTSENHNFSGNFTLWTNLSVDLDYTYKINALIFSSQSEENYQILTYKNLDQHNFSMGLGYYYQYKFWTMNYYANLSYVIQEKIDLLLDQKNQPNFYFYTSQQFSLPENFALDLSYYYVNKNTSATLHLNARQGVDLGVQKKFIKIPLQISINYNDIGNLSSQYKFLLPETGQKIFVNTYSSSIQLRLRYNFGQPLANKNLSDQKINSRLGTGGGF